jgi:y4mF family transcriptional regulator
MTASEIGNLIRERRRAAGLTQARAAGLCNVGVRFLSDLENGKETAAIGKALQVLQGLGLEVTIAPRGPARRSGG